MVNPPRRISDLLYAYEFDPGRLAGRRKRLGIQYAPLVRRDEWTLFQANELTGYVQTEDFEHVPLEMIQKLESLEKVLGFLLPSYELDTGGDPSPRMTAAIAEIRCEYMSNPPAEAPSHFSIRHCFQIAPRQTTLSDVPWNNLSRSERLLIGNVASWVKKQAWEDLANKVRTFSGQGATAVNGHKVFLSYKQQSKAAVVADNIAHRLSKQRIEVWYDKWDIRAGDSVVGKIGEGFKGCDACLVFLEAQYSSSNWCTKEMSTALTKALTEKFTVIPVLVEHCEKPELLKDLMHVDLRDPSAEEFERKLSEITDAIYKVDLNPYR